MACAAATKPLPLSAATFKMNNLFSIFCPTKEIAFHRSSDIVVDDNKMKIYMAALCLRKNWPQQLQLALELRESFFSLPLSPATFKMNKLFSIYCPTKEIAFDGSSGVVVCDNKGIHLHSHSFHNLLTMWLILWEEFFPHCSYKTRWPLKSSHNLFTFLELFSTKDGILPEN